MMEHCGLVAAMRHARQATFGMNPNILFRTASIDSLSFLSPVRIGDIITVRAYVSRVWTTSLEVYITVHTHSLNYNHYDDLNKGNIANKSEWKFSNDGYMTFIAVEDGMEDRVGSLSPGASHRTFQFQQNKWSLPDVFPVAPEEIERYDAAVDRRSRRLKERQELKNRLVDQIN
jgi:acyl-CoA hydrolase